jgi:2-polyprenyl-3-methyl-5-hydroxy-6-metoxy-1,4-benzoquinol methylase
MLLTGASHLPRTGAGGVTVTASDEAQARALFQERYRNPPSLLASQIEQRVIGGDWGANGCTTMAQADTLARELHLSAGDRLLDLGTGRGWPGLYLAVRTGCRVILADLPLEGLRVAADRATSEGIAARVGVVAAAASGLPFQANSFDVVIHTDVLC